MSIAPFKPLELQTPMGLQDQKLERYLKDWKLHLERWTTRLIQVQKAATSIPTGTIIMTGKATAPDGFLLCDGSVVSQQTYEALFAIVGTAFNTGGEAGGKFRLPDLRSRSPMGAGQGGGLTTRALGVNFGQETASHKHSHTHDLDAALSYASLRHDGTAREVHIETIAKPFTPNQTVAGGATATTAAEQETSTQIRGTTDLDETLGAPNVVHPIQAVTFAIKT